MLESVNLKDKLKFDFWKSKLLKKPNYLLEPFTVDGMKTTGFTSFKTQIPGIIDLKIDKLCNQQPSLKYAFYASVVCLLFQRYSSAHAIQLASPILKTNEENRSKDCINFYHFDLDKDLNFKELFGIVKNEILTSIKYQGVKFEYLKSHLPSVDFDNRFQICFSYGGITEATPLEKKFMMYLTIKANADDFELNLVVNDESFNSIILRNLTSNYLHLISQIVENPYLSISKYSILGDDEKEILFSRFNNTYCALPNTASIIQVTEKQAIERGNQVAVCCNDNIITYQELNERANKIARIYQTKANVGSGDIVVVLMDRSIEMMVILLGVWKCGGVYLALDPILPDKRVENIVFRAGAKLVVTTTKYEHIQKVISVKNRTFLNIDNIQFNQGGLEKTNLNIKIQENDGAYLIYTSGSTGEPKGVFVEHIGMINHMYAFIDELNLDENSIIAQNASSSFDISVWQFFTALLVGGTTAIFPQDLITNTQEFINEIQNKKVSILETVPSYLFLMLDQISLNLDYNLSHLKYMMVTGESIKPSLVNTWFEKFPDIPLVNAYGPTEASDDITLHFINQPTATELIPIGHVLQNLHIYILDSHGQLCPVGVKGEIVVSGIGVARGYLNDIEKTVRSFGVDPFREAQNVRLYKTGDIGRYLPNGDIQFFGRVDYQVKIQGYRIELEEIEAVLSTIEGIKEVAVLDLVSTIEGKYLCAYITWSNQTRLLEDEIKAALGDLLPVYMIPANIFTLEEMPLLDNGKINRKKLPAPSQLEVASADPQIGAKSEFQQKLINIWQEVLGKTEIGINEDFFKLGGYSLLAIKAISRIQNAFKTKVNVGDLFFNPTIKTFSKILEQNDNQTYLEIFPVEECEYYNVSHAQKRLWILDQLGAQTAYNISAAFKLTGNISIAALEKSFQLLFLKHEILRTTFIEVNGLPKQKIHSPEDFGFKLMLLNARNAKDLSQLIKDEMVRESAFEFQLDLGPLIRVKLIQVDQTHYVLLLTMHHIISDGSSTDNLITDISRFYGLYNQSEDFEIECLNVQYKDFAIWQNRQLEGKEAEKHQSYLQNHFSGELPLLQLPTDYPRPAIKTYNGDSKIYHLKTELYRKLKDIASKNEVTLFMTLVAWIKVLCFKYTNQNDVIIGSSIMGREQTILEQQIGLYLNTIAIRTKFDKNDGFSTLLQKVRRIVLDAYAHQSYPIDKLIEDLGLGRDLGRSPLFDVMIDLQEVTEVKFANDSQVSGIKVTEMPTNAKTSRFDIQFSFLKETNGLTLGINYNTDLFSLKSIDRLVEHMMILLEAIYKDLQRPIIDLDILSQQEKVLYTRGLAPNALPSINNKSIETLFELQVEKCPTDLAVVFGNKSLTYSELNQLANQLANHLRTTYDLKENNIVGILLEKSEWMFVALLGILKSGAAFLPIDTKYPIERVNFILEDAKIDVLITDTSSMFAIPESFDGNIFAIDVQIDGLASSTSNLKELKNLNRLAYVIYTSGSSGRPKGVKIVQSNIVNYITWANEYYFQNKSGFPFAIFTSFSFDLTLTGMLSTLLRGDTAYVYGDDDINLIIEKIFKTASTANTVKLTPSHINIISYLNLKSTSVRCVVIGGETLLQSHVDILLDLNPGMLIYNEYGPTEATVGCTVKRINRGDEEISIGKPIANTNIYILNENLSLQPIGVPGEIAISGAGVARGYLNRQALTQKKFIKNPYDKASNLYLTGDIGCMMHNNEVKYIGRKDDQVKIMGYRIEKQEIEKVLNEIDGIEQVVVAEQLDKQQQYYLMAYYTGDKAIKILEIRQHLSTYLPDYMHPGSFVYVDIFPLTENGKTDFDKLFKINSTITEGNYEAPNSELEKSLTTIWEDVLDREKIGIRDNFFHLGGNSLKGVQLLSRMNIGGKIGLKDIFQNPTIEQLAKEIEIIEWIKEDTNATTTNGAKAKKIVI